MGKAIDYKIGKPGSSMFYPMKGNTDSIKILSKAINDLIDVVNKQQEEIKSIRE